MHVVGAPGLDGLRDLLIAREPPNRRIDVGADLGCRGIDVGPGLGGRGIDVGPGLGGRGIDVLLEPVQSLAKVGFHAAIITLALRERGTAGPARAISAGPSRPQRRGRYQ